MLDGILQGASDNSYQVKLVRVPPSAHERAIGHIEDGSVDGVILVALWADSPLVRYMELGHRRIGIITGDWRQWSARRREQGYLMALREAGITPLPSWRYEGNCCIEAGEAGALRLMQQEPRPTAIVCGNDRMAIGALHLLSEQGLRVPQDVSILGFDDAVEAAFTVPPLTSICQSMFEIGLRATELLLQQIEQGNQSRHSLLLPTERVVRATVAPPLPE